MATRTPPTRSREPQSVDRQIDLHLSPRWHLAGFLGDSFLMAGFHSVWLASRGRGSTSAPSAAAIKYRVLQKLARFEIFMHAQPETGSIN
jgi:hypothetical protein